MLSFNIYLFMWLRWVLAVACRLFVAAQSSLVAALRISCPVASGILVPILIAELSHFKVENHKKKSFQVANNYKK